MYLNLRFFLVFHSITCSSNLLISPLQPDLLPKAAVQPCPGYEKSFLFIDLINQAQNTQLFKFVPPDPAIIPCKDNAKLLAKLVGECPEGNGVCDLSYVVFILSKINGMLMVVGQGIRLRDCSILTVYGNTQFEDDLWVKYPDGVTKKVICIKKLQQSSRNVLSESVYTVQLVVESGCCTDYGFCEPIVETSKGSPFISGYLIQQTNCTSTDYSISPIFGLAIHDPTGAALSFVINDKPDKICLGFQGGVFVTNDCKVLGIAVAKPIVAVNAIFSVPLAQEIGTECVVFLIPVE